MQRSLRHGASQSICSVLGYALAECSGTPCGLYHSRPNVYICLGMQKGIRSALCQVGSLSLFSATTQTLYHNTISTIPGSER